MMTEAPQQRLMTAQEVAELLAVPRSWVYHAAREGIIPSVEAGRYRRFRRSDVDAFIAQGGDRDD